jgi:hypothetical protein
VTPPDEPQGGGPAPPPFPPGREKPTHEGEPPAVGATEPVLAGSDLIPPVVPGTAPPERAVPPPPPRGGGTDFAAYPPPPPTDPYPVRFDIAYADRLSRLSTLFRVFLLVPLWVVAWLLQYLAVPVLVVARIAVILKRTYPRWLFDAGAAYLAWTARFNAYVFLQTDHYPSFDSPHSPVTLEYDYPDPRALSRWKGVIWRLVLVIPHLLALFCVFVAVIVVCWIAWFAILFTGRYPRGMFDFVTGAWRWYYRVTGYLFGFTDRFPPFSLAPVVGTAGGAATAASGIAGLVAAGGATAGIVAVAVWSSKVTHADVDYAALEAGNGQVIHFIANLGSEDEPFAVMALNRVIDPADRLVQVIETSDDERVIVFEWFITTGPRSAHIEADPARLKVQVGDETETYSPELATLGGRGAPLSLARDDQGQLRIVFVVPADAEPLELRFDPDFHPRGGILYEFR